MSAASGPGRTPNAGVDEPVARGGHPALAGLVVLLVGVNLPLKYALGHLTFAQILPFPPLVLFLPMWPVVLLLPVWAATIARYPFARTLFAVACLAIGWGVLLAWTASTDHAVNPHEEFITGLTVFTTFGAVGVLLWACEALRVDVVAVLFGVGLLASEALTPSSWAANPWKYGFALPVAIIALGLAGRAGSLVAAILAMTGLGLVSVLSDYRSFAAFCVVTLLVLLWQEASRSTRARIHKAAPLFMLAAVGMGVYFILENMLVGGYLGAGLQERSIAQIQASGSLLTGGRPEWAATLRLMTHRPQGYGLGVLPNAVDVNLGDAGLQSVNVDPENGYEAYMFSGGFRLHSIAADLWAAAGWGGVLLALVLLVILLQRLSTALAERTATPLLVFTVVIAIWALAFSPIFTDFKDLTLAAFVALSTQRTAAGGWPFRGRHRVAPGQGGTMAISRRRVGVRPTMR